MHPDIGKNTLSAKLNPETQLLLRSLAPHPDVQPDDFAHLDPDGFLHILECHRLTNVLYNNIKDTEVFPATIRDRLRERAAGNTFRMLTYTAELCRVLQLLQRNHIDALALKGPLLGQLYYDDYTQRECKDLDILVQLADVEAAYQLLTGIGYELSDVLWNSPKQKAIYTGTFHHYNLYKPTNKVQIELHWRLNALGRDLKKNTEHIWQNIRVEHIGGLPIQTLGKSNQFIYLCIHGGTHQWKRLFWVQDIVQIIEKEGSDFLVIIYQKLIKKSTTRYVLQGCYLAHTLFRVELPQIIYDAIDNDKKIKALAEVAIQSMNSVCEPYSSPLSSIEAFKSAIKRLINFYRSSFYLEGHQAFRTLFSNFFVNPAYWKIFSFSDRFFILNYLAAPILWIYSVFNTDHK